MSGELVNSLAGTFVGTTYYLSPERIRGGQYSFVVFLPLSLTAYCVCILTPSRNSINSDVWSMAVTVLEIALNHFPFPGEGEAPLNGPIELLTYLVRMEQVEIPDDPALGIKYTNAFRNFIQVWCGPPFPFSPFSRLTLRLLQPREEPRYPAWSSSTHLARLDPSQSGASTASGSRILGSRFALTASCPDTSVSPFPPRHSDTLVASYLSHTQLSTTVFFSLSSSGSREAG